VIQPLTGKQARYLRGLGHHLQPIVMVGKDEISDRLVASVDEALSTHELIKLKLQDGCLMNRKDVAYALAYKCDAGIAQILGKTILLYRASENNLITIPADKD
jgi:RNA-binding protein